MSRGRNFLKYWLPVMLWMFLIFTASSDKLSTQHSSRFLEPVIRWLFPHLADETVYQLVFLARKCAHLTEFAVLALLIWRAWRQPVRQDPRPWQWSQAGFALLCTALYATSDEIHQLFVPHREGRVQDVVIDTVGAALGLLALWLLGKWRKRW
jgi:VanZ family protein